MQIVVVQCARAIDLLIVNFSLKGYNKVSMTAAERMCLGSLLLQQWMQMHWLCSFWGMALATTACAG